MADCGCEFEAKTPEHARVLWTLLAVNGGMFLVEILAGLGAESAALVGDSLDMFADGAVYAVALWAVSQSPGSKVFAARLGGYVQLALGILGLAEVARRMLKGKALRTKSLAARVQPHDPRLTLERQARRLELLSGALTRAHSRKMGAQADALRHLREALLPSGMALTQEARGALAQNVAALDALSPLRVLGRGYAIALGPGGRALRGPEDVAAGDQIEVRVARAAVQAEVLSVDRLAPESTLGEEST